MRRRVAPRRGAKVDLDVTLADAQLADEYMKRLSETEKQAWTSRRLSGHVPGVKLLFGRLNPPRSQQSSCNTSSCHVSKRAL
jgi:hypothetical protein